jgi:hypothetical protein
MERRFSLRVTGTEYGELQGAIRAEGGGTQIFQSVLELLRIMDTELTEETRSPDRTEDPHSGQMRKERA